MPGSLPEDFPNADARMARAEALGTLFDETRLLFHRMRAAAAELHGQGEPSAGRRGVLNDPARNGPQTPPTSRRLCASFARCGTR